MKIKKFSFRFVFSLRIALLAVIFIAGSTLVSCTPKLCPAYSKIETETIENLQLL